MFLRILALCLLSLATAANAAPDAKATQALHALFDADYQRQLQDDPLGASYLGDDRYNDKLPDLSPAAMSARQQSVRDSRATLVAIDRNKLNDADQLNFDIYLRELDERIAGFRFHDEQMPVSHQGGVHTLADGVLQGLRFEKAKDYSDWIARLRAYAKYMDQTIALMRQGMASGWTPPKAIMQRVPAQIAAQIVATAEASSYYSPFTTMSSKVSADEQRKLRAEAKAAVSEVVLPALKRFQTFFNNEYLPKCRDSVAASGKNSAGACAV